ncbi:MAG: putative internalin [Nocardioides sp.]|jgi:hypothetical protein|uniref:hypothetical protein n=1 Tax=Nocardioides sp. TaxID=35761 RepID=UPI0026225C4B|nr:hypothetical protein [Nocardioides sp.]MCW2834121.1 putative internalin [Nocardioides sp.]
MHALPARCGHVSRFIQGHPGCSPGGALLHVVGTPAPTQAQPPTGTPGKDQLLAYARLTIYVDTAAPQTTITAAPRYATDRDVIRVEFSASEPSSTFQCRWDEGAWAACVGSTTVSLIPGNHMISVRASDAYGNTDPTPATAVVTVTAVASQPPPPPSAPAEPTVEAHAVKRKSKLRIHVGPGSSDGDYRVVIQRKVGAKWRKVDRVRTRGDRDVVVVDLRRGTYRAVLTTSSQGPAIRSSTVRIKR